MQVLLFFLFAFICTAQFSWYPVPAGDVIQKPSGSNGYYKYTATINEAMVGSPGRLSFTMSPTTNAYQASLSVCYPGSSSYPFRHCEAGVECVLDMPPCSTNGQDFYDYQQDYYLSLQTSEALNFTVTDEAVSVTTMGDSYAGSISLSGTVPPFAPSTYAVFEYNKANADDLSQFVLSSQASSTLYFFSDDATNICKTLFHNPNSGGSVSTFFESAISGCPFPTGTRYLSIYYDRQPPTTVATVDIWAVQDTARSTSNQYTDLTTNTRVPITWANVSQPFAFVRFQLQPDRYVSLTLENPLTNAACSIAMKQDNPAAIPTPNVVGGKCAGFKSAFITASNSVDIRFSACEAGTWYLTLFCDASEVDANSNGFYMTLGPQQTATQIFGTAIDATLAVTGSYTTSPQLIAFADNAAAGSTLPDNALDKFIYVRFNDTQSTGSSSTVRFSRGAPASDDYSACGRAPQFSAPYQMITAQSFPACSMAPNAGTLHAYIDGGSTPNYQLTVTSRGPADLPRDSTVSGAIDAGTTSYHSVDIGSSTTLTIFTPTVASGALSMSSFDTTKCQDFPLYKPSLSQQRVTFCWDLGTNFRDDLVAPWPNNPSYLTLYNYGTSDLDISYSIQSASYERGSSLRTDWIDLASPVEVAFDGSVSNNWVRTVEWDNQFEGFTVTLTASAPVTFNLNVLDGCVNVFSASYTLINPGSTVVFGTGSFYRPLNDPTIRLFMEQSSVQGANVTFTYTPRGNCLDSTTVAAQATFCQSWITTGDTYSFPAVSDIQRADQQAQTQYFFARSNFNTSEVTPQCLADLTSWACQSAFPVCEVSGEVPTYPCTGICDTILMSCPSSSCFDASCRDVNCPSSGSQLVVGLSMLLVTILALVF